MNKLTKTAALAAAFALGSQAVHAATSDLLLGFESYNSTASSYSSDNILDLGSASSLGAGAGGITDLGTINATTAGWFSTALSGNVNTILASIAGGTANGSSSVLYASSVRVGNAGNYATAGTETALPTMLKSQVTSLAGNPATVINDNSSLTGFNSGAIVSAGAAGSGPSYYQNVVGGETTLGFSGLYPQAIGASGIYYLDLFEVGESTTHNAFNYEGTLEVNLNTDNLTFLDENVSAVPEPATYGAIAGFGLLIVALRKQLRRQQA